MPGSDLGQHGTVFLIATVIAVFCPIAPSSYADAFGTVRTWPSEEVWCTRVGHKASVATHVWVHVRPCGGGVSKIAEVGSSRQSRTNCEPLDASPLFAGKHLYLSTITIFGLLVFTIVTLTTTITQVLGEYAPAAI